MSEENSPMYLLGLADGAADAERVGRCPPQPPDGPTPPHPGYPVMYQRGYYRAFAAAVPHVCTAACERESGGEA
jgi:hypothetical protein